MLLIFIWSFYFNHARVFNMVMLVIVVAGLTANMIVRRQQIARRTRRIMGWIYAFMLNVVYGYAISIHEHRPFNWSVGVGTVLLIGIFASIMWHPRGDDKPPPHDGAVTSRFMFWLDRRVRTAKRNGAARKIDRVRKPHH